MATEIIYPYPVPDITDMEARLLLEGSAVTDWVAASAYAIETIHAGYLASFAAVDGEEVEADAVQWVSVTEGLADEVALTSAAQVDLQPVLDAIAAGNSGTGANAVTITVTDGTNPLQNAAVRLSEGAHSYTAVTNSSGVASFSLDAATYTLSISKAGYSFTPESIVVDGAESVTKAMALIAAPAPVSPAMSAIYMDVIDNGEPKDGIQIRATLIGSPPLVIDGDYEYKPQTDLKTGHDGTAGRVTFPTYPGRVYRVTCENPKIDKKVTAPAAGTSADVYEVDAV